MRLRDEFSVYKRRMPSGHTVYYYQIYDEDGKRSCGHSTGKATKTAARAFCVELIRERRLDEFKRSRVPTFAEFAEGWWVRGTCPYIESKEAREPLSKRYINRAKCVLDAHILPTFGSTRIDKITEEMIDEWLKAYIRDGYKNNAVNSTYKIFRTMMKFAYKKNVISRNPCDLVSALKVERKKRDLLTLGEYNKLFPKVWSGVWDDYTCYAATRLASVTGMRVGEVLGVKTQYVRGNALNVCGQSDSEGEYLDHTKTKEDRVIPVSPGIVRELDGLLEKNKEGFLFSRDGGMTAVSYEDVTSAYKTALESVGISREEYERRGLSFHSWRHFLNTRLLAENVARSKVQAVTGHVNDAMTDWYTHFKPEEFAEVMDVQEGLMRPGRKQKRAVRDRKRVTVRLKKEGAGARRSYKR
jgi:integrase